MDTPFETTINMSEHEPLETNNLSEEEIDYLDEMYDYERMFVDER